MSRGNSADTPNTYLVPYVSIKDPEKYDDAMPPTATEPQHRLWRDPERACDSPRALVTTMLSMTTSAKAVESEPRVNANTAPGTSFTTVHSENPAPAPRNPHRAR